MSTMTFEFTVPNWVKDAEWASYLCADNSNLRTSVDVNTAVRLATDAAADSVGNADNQSTTSPTVAKCQQRVGCLAWTLSRWTMYIAEVQELASLHQQSLAN